MDVVLDAYIREVTLEKWREVEDLQQAAGLTAVKALRGAGEFAARGPYAPLWGRWWRRHVKKDASQGDGELIASIEQAVRGALTEECGLRSERGEPDIEDTPHYKAFVERAMGQLLEEASGEIEEMD